MDDGSCWGDFIVLPDPPHFSSVKRTCRRFSPGPRCHVWQGAEPVTPSKSVTSAASGACRRDMRKELEEWRLAKAQRQNQSQSETWWKIPGKPMFERFWGMHQMYGNICIVMEFLSDSVFHHVLIHGSGQSIVES